MIARVLMVIVVAGGLAAVLLFMPDYYITLLNYAGLASLVTLGLLLLTGVGALTSFGQATFVGLSAYTTAYLTTVHGIAPIAALPVALLVTCVVALLLGALTLRLAGHYLPLGTIAWGLSLYYLFGNLEFLGGHTGIGNIPPIRIFGIAFNENRHFFLLEWVVVLGAFWLIHNLLYSRHGRAIRALRRGEVLVEAMGIDSARSKMAIFIIAALLAAVSGWLYAHMQRFVNPTPFNLSNSIEYLFMAVVGGAASVWGALLGAGVIVVLKDFLTGVLPKMLGNQGNYEVLVFGAFVVLMLQWSPGGISELFVRLWPRARRSVQIDSKAVALTRRNRGDKAGEVLMTVAAASKSFGGLRAVNDISFEIRFGEILALIGPNGAGKTTLFSLISGVLPLTSGDVYFRGEKINGLRPYRVAQRGIGRTFQHVRLVPHMTALENVAIGAHRRGRAGLLRSALHLERAEEASLLAEARNQLERVGLANRADALVGSLPLGEQRIVEIARALASDPCLLLLDEPAAGLRHLEKKALANLLRTLRGEGVAVLLVEHDMDFVMRLVDRVVVMDFGEKIAEGVPRDVQRNPDVLKAYLGGVS